LRPDHIQNIVDLELERESGVWIVGTRS